MKFYQSRKYHMIWMVSGWLKKNKEKLSKRVPALGNLIDEFLNLVEAIQKLRIANPNRVELKTLTKQATRDGLVQSILELSSMLRASRYKNSATKKNESPQAKSRADAYHYTRSDLKRAKADELIKIAKQIIDASKKTKFTARYGITAGDIKEAEAYYKEFAGIKLSPILKKKEVAKENKELNARLNNLDEILQNSIDPLMVIATKDDQEMRVAYKATRKVLHRGPGRITDQEERYRKSREKKDKPKGEGDNEPQ